MLDIYFVPLEVHVLASKSVMKILDIGDRMVATMAGGAADCQFWTRIVAKYCTYVHEFVRLCLTGISEICIRPLIQRFCKTRVT